MKTNDKINDIKEWLESLQKRSESLDSDWAKGYNAAIRHALEAVGTIQTQKDKSNESLSKTTNS